MLDATAKLQSGVLYGNVMHLGNFDECLEISKKLENNTIKGQYCTAQYTAHEKYGEYLDNLVVNTIVCIINNVGV